MCIPRNKGYVEKARADYEHALQHFTSDSDKERQHLYLCQAECESGNIEAGLNLMLLAENLDYLGIDSVETFLTKITSQEVSNAIYKYLAYYRIMSYAKRYGHREIAESMYKLVLKHSVTIESFKSGYKGIHPLELIYWYAGDYFADSDVKKACRYYDLAIDLCSRDAKEVTLRVIQLGVLASKALAYLSKHKCNEATIVVKKISCEYASLLSEDLPESIFDYIKMLATINTDTIDTLALEKFAAQARAIN